MIAQPAPTQLSYGILVCSSVLPRMPAHSKLIQNSFKTAQRKACLVVSLPVPCAIVRAVEEEEEEEEEEARRMPELPVLSSSSSLCPLSHSCSFNLDLSRFCSVRVA